MTQKEMDGTSYESALFQGVPEALLSKLASLMDPEEVLMVINFCPEGTQKFPGKLRCFCPVHRDKVLRTMTIETDRKRFVCRYARCKGAKGGDLLTLYVLATGATPSQAVEFWCQRLGIDSSLYPSAPTVLPKEEAPSPEEVLELSAVEAITQTLQETYPKEPETTSAPPSPAEHPEAQASEEQKGVGFSLEDLLRLEEDRKVQEPASPPHEVNIPPWTPATESDLLQIIGKPPEALSQDWQQWSETAEMAGDKERAVEILKQALDQALLVDNEPCVQSIEERLVTRFPEQVALRRSIIDFNFQKSHRREASMAALSLSNYCRQEGDLLTASEILDRARDFAPENAELLEGLVGIYAEQHRDLEASSLNLRLAELYKESDLHGKAMTAYREAIRLLPSNTNARRQLADLCLSRGMVSEALDELHAVGDVYLGEDDQEQAEKTYRRILEIDSSNFQSLQKLAILYRRQNQLDKLESAYLSLASVFEKQALIGRAIKVLEGAIRTLPDSVPLLERLAQAYADKGDDHLAAQAYEHLLTLSPENAEARQFLSEHSVRTIVAPRPSAALSAQDLVMRGRQFAENADFDDAEKAFREALEAEPNNVSALLSLASLLASLNRVSEAFSELAKSSGISGEEGRLVREKLLQVGQRLFSLPESDRGGISKESLLLRALSTGYELARDYQQSGFHGKALQTLSTLRELDPSDPRTLEQMIEIYSEGGSIDRLTAAADDLAALYRARGELENIGEAYEHLLTIDPGNLHALESLENWQRERGSLGGSFQVSLLLAAALASKGLVGRAAEIFKQARAEQLEAMKTCGEEEKAELLPRVLQLTERLSASSRARGDNRESALDCVFTAQQLFERGESKAAVNLLRQIVAERPDEVSAWSVLAENYLALGRKAEALECYTRVAEILDTEQVYADESARKQLRNAYDSILELQPQAIWAEENLTRLLIRLGEEDEALERLRALLQAASQTNDKLRMLSAAKQIASLDSKDSKNLLMLKEMLLERNDVSGAIEVLEDLFGLVEEQREGKPESEKIAILEEIVKLDPTKEERRRQLAELFSSSGQTERSLAEWSALCQLWLAQGKMNQAEVAFRERIRLSPDAPDPWEGLANLQRMVGKVSESVASYCEAAKMLLRLERPQDALKAVRTVLQLDPWCNDGMSLMMSLAEIGAVPEQEINRWADQIVQTAEREIADKAEASTVDRLSRLAAAVPTNRRARGVLASALKSTNRSEEAIVVLKGLSEDSRTEGRLSEAAQFLSQCVELKTTDFEMRLSLADILLSLGNREGALEQLFQTLPLLIKVDEFQQAAAISNRLLELGGEKIDHLRRVVDSLELAVSSSAKATASGQLAAALIGSRLALLRLLEAQIGIPEVQREASALSRRIVESDPSCAHAWSVLGQTSAIDSPERVEALLKAAVLYEEQKQNDLARRLALQISLHGGPSVSHQLVQLLVRLGEVEVAIKHELALVDAMAQKGELSDAANELSIILERFPNRVDLLESFFAVNKGLEKRDEAENAASRLAEEFVRQANLPQAISWQRKALWCEDVGTDTDILIEEGLSAGRLLATEERRDLILDRVSRLVDLYDSAGLNSEKREIMELTARLLDRHELYELSGSYLKRLLKEDPEDIGVMSELSEICFILKDLSTARDLLLRSARILRGSNRLESAFEFYMKAVRCFPPEETEPLRSIWRENAQMYLSVGRLEQAVSVSQLASEFFHTANHGDQIPLLVEELSKVGDSGGPLYEALSLFYLNHQQVAESTQAALHASEFYIKQQWFSKAQQIYQTMLDRDLANVDAAKKLATLYAQRGMEREALLLFTNLSERLKDEPSSGDLRRMYLDLAKEIEPDNAQVLQGYISLFESELESATKKADKESIKKSLAECCARMGSIRLSEDPEAALEYITRSLEYDAKQPLALEIKARIRQREDERAPRQAFLSQLNTALQLVDDGDFTQAEPLFEKILEVEPENLKAIAGLSQSMHRSNRTDKAVALLEERAKHFLSQNLLPQAQKCFEQCCEFEPTRWAFRESLAELFTRTGYREKAVESYSQALSLAQSQAPSEALRIAERATSLDPDNDALRETYASILESNQRREEARGVWSALALRAGERGDATKEERCLERSLSLYPTGTPSKEELQARYRLSVVLMRQGRTEPASDELEKAINGTRQAELWSLAVECLEFASSQEPIDPRLKNEEKIRWLAESYQNIGDSERAVETYQNLAETLSNANQLAASLEAYKAILAIRKDETSALEAASRLSKDLGREDETSSFLGSLLAAFQSRGLIARAEQTAQALLDLDRERLGKTKGKADKKSLAKKIGETVNTFASLMKERGRDKAIPALLCNTGEFLCAEGFAADGLALAQAALSENPEHLESLVAAAGILEDLGRRAETLELYRRMATLLDTPSMLMEDRNRELLEKSYRALVELAPAEAPLRASLANVLESNGKIDEARTVLSQSLDVSGAESPAVRLSIARKLISISPLDVDVWRQIAELELSLSHRDQAVEALQRLDNLLESTSTEEPETLEIRLDTLRKLVALQPSLLEKRLQLGDLCVQLKKADEAIQIYFELAQSLRSAGQLSQAETCCRRLIELHDTRVETKALLAEVLAAKGQKQDAVAERLGLINLYREKGQSDLVEAECRSVLELEPWNAEVLACLLESAKDASATERSDWLLRLSQLASRALESGRADEAQTIYERTLQVQPKDADLLEGLALALEAAQKPDEALACRQRLHPILQRKERTSDLIQSLRRCLALAPNDPDILLALADQYALLGNTLDAAESYQLAGDLLCKKQNWDSAAAAYSKAIDSTPLNLDAMRSRIKALTSLPQPQAKEILDSQRRLFTALLESPRTTAAQTEIRVLAETLIAKDPSDESVWLALADSWTDEDESMKAKILLSLAETQLKAQKTAQALAALKRIQSLSSLSNKHRRLLLGLLKQAGTPEDVLREWIVLVDSLYAQGEDDDAVAEMEACLDAFPDSLELRERFYKSSLDLGKNNQAREQAIYISERFLAQSDLLSACNWLEEAIQVGQSTREGKDLKRFLQKGGFSAEARDLVARLAEMYATAERSEEGQFVFLALARDLESIESFDRAIEFLERARSLNEENPEIWSLLAKLYGRQQIRDKAADTSLLVARHYRKSGMRQEAETWYRESLTNVDSSSVRAELAELLWTMGSRQSALDEIVGVAESRLRSEGAKSACSAFDRFLAEDPENTQLLTALAKIHQQAGDTNSQVEVLIKAADSWRRKEFLSKAQGVYQEILRLSPTCSEASERLAEIYLERGMEEEAIQQYLLLANRLSDVGADVKRENLLRQVLIWDTENLNALEGLSDLYQRRLEQAEESKEAEVVNEAKSVLIEVNLKSASTLLRQNDLDGAEKCLSLVAKWDPSNALGEQLEKEIETRQAAQLPREALLGLLTQARELVAAGHNDLATERYEAILEKDPLNLAAILPLAEIFVETDQTERACDLYESKGEELFGRALLPQAQNCLERCAKLDPNRKKTCQLIARVYSSLGMRDVAAESLVRLATLLEPEDAQGAIRTLREAETLSPSQTAVRVRIANLLGQTEQFEEARREYYTAIEAYQQIARSDLVASTIENLLKNASPPDSESRQGLQLRLARCWFELDRTERAAKLAQQLADEAFSEEHWDVARNAYELLLSTQGLEAEYASLSNREHLAQCCQHAGAFQKAADQLTLLADEAVRRGDFSRALEAYQQTFELTGESVPLERAFELACRIGDPDKALAKGLQLAGIYVQKGLLGRADGVYQQLLHAEQHRETPFPRAEVYNAASSFYFDKGESEKAVTCLLELASRWEQAGQSDKQEAIYQKILSLNLDTPKSFSAYLSLARIQEATGRSKEAVQTYRKLVEIHRSRENLSGIVEVSHQIMRIAPEETSTYHTLAQAYAQLHQIPEAVGYFEWNLDLFSQQAQWESALNCLEILMSIRPEEESYPEKEIEILYKSGRSADGFARTLQLAQECLDRGNPERAVLAYQNALRMDPKNAEIEARIQSVKKELDTEKRRQDQTDKLAEARLLETTGDLAGAIASYESLLRMGIPEPIWLEDLARLYESSGRAGSREHLERAVDVYTQIAQQAQSAKNPDRTVIFFKKACALAPERVGLLNTLAVVYTESGQIEKASETYVKAAEIYLAQGQSDALEDAYRKIIVLEPENSTVRGKLGSLLAERGSIDEAVEQFYQQSVDYANKELLPRAVQALQRVLNLNPDHIPARRKLANLYLQKGDARAALEQQREVVHLLLRAGKSNEAIQEYQNALEVDPESVSLRVELANLYSQIGRSDNALRERMALLALCQEKELVGQTIETCEVLLRDHPKETQVSALLVRTLLDGGQSAKALKECMRLATLIEKDDPETATQRYQTVLEISSGHLQAHQGLIRIHRRAKNKEQAFVHLVAAGEILMNSGQYHKAAQALWQAIQMEPRAVAVYRQLAISQEMMGEIEHSWNTLESRADVLASSGYAPEAVREYLRLADLYSQETEAAD